MADKASNTCSLALKLADSWCQAASLPCLVSDAIISGTLSLSKACPGFLTRWSWAPKRVGTKAARLRNQIVQKSDVSATTTRFGGWEWGMEPLLVGGAAPTSPWATYWRLEKLPPSVKILCKCPTELPSTAKFNPRCLTELHWPHGENGIQSRMTFTVALWCP